MKTMRILLSNDDGIMAPGLAAMREALTGLGHVDVVAPVSAQSAAGHGITVDTPLVAQQIHVQESFFGFAVQGRPADCVKLAVADLLDAPPDLVVSGINDGANVAINVLYSGTVAAAAEGALLGLPAVAVSLKQGIERDFKQAAALAVDLIEQLLEAGLSGGQLVNINVPDLTPGPPKGVRVVQQATRTMADEFVRHSAPDGKDYYWLQGADFAHAEHPTDNDLDAINERYIAITPLQFDMTQYALMEQLRERDWTIDT